MKSEKGVTLTALVVYMLVFSIILGIMTFVSNYFYKNLGQIKDSPKYISEFNKFSMFFVSDAKKNNDVTSVTATDLVFEDGTSYSYKNNCIYRNGQRIAKYIKNFTFTKSDNTVDGFTKKIVNVKTAVGNNKEQINRNIDFVLKYW